MPLPLKTFYVFGGAPTWINRLHEEGKLDSRTLHILFYFLPQRLVVVILLPGTVLLFRQRMVSVAYNSNTTSTCICLRLLRLFFLFLLFVEVESWLCNQLLLINVVIVVALPQRVIPFRGIKWEVV